MSFLSKNDKIISEILMTNYGKIKLQEAMFKTFQFIGKIECKHNSINFLERIKMAFKFLFKSNFLMFKLILLRLLGFTIDPNKYIKKNI